MQLPAAVQPQSQVGQVPALKEWAAVVHALLRGRQTLLLRKGGIRERAFVTERDRFVIFPTVAHSHEERVRPEHRDLLETGWTDVDEATGAFTVRCGISVIDVVHVEHADALGGLEDLHIWTPEHVGERLAFRPKHPLQVIVVQARAMPATRLRRDPGYDGCRSWVELPLGWSLGWDDPPGEPALPKQHLRAVAGRVRQAVA